MPPLRLRITVATPVFNRADLLRETMRSVFAQTLQPCEYIIIDDGSTDHILSMLSEFRDDRIRYVRQPHTGKLSRLRQKAVEMATGEYIAFIDSDDLWHPEKLEFMADSAQKTGAMLVLSDCQYFDDRGKLGTPIGTTLQQRDDVFREMLYRNHSFAFGTNLFLRKEAGITYFDVRLWASEHDLVLRFAAFHNTVYVDRVLNHIRRHEGNMSGPMSITDIIAPLEFNRTLEKLASAKKIGKQDYDRIRARNFANVGLAYYKRRSYRRAVRYSWTSFLLHPGISYLKLLLKAVFRQIGGRRI